MSGVLDGVRVLTLEHWVALPGATAILADWGAEVIKIEHPQTGDAARGYQAFDLSGVITPLNPIFEADNRNKRSLGLDLTRPEGVAVLHRLVREADVFATNLLPQSVARLGCDEATLRALNPSLVYLHFTGYGTQGPDANREGYDYAAFWARSGIMSLLGEPDMPPVTQRPGMGDHTTSLAIVSGIMGALYHRARTGEGQRVEVSLLRTALWVLSIDVHACLFSGQPVARTSRTAAGNPLFNYYRTSDGHWIQLIMLQPDRFWPAFCEAIGQPAWRDDPRFATMAARRANRQELIALLDAIIATKTRDEWARIFDAHGIFWGRVQQVHEVLADPQTQASGAVDQVTSDGGQAIPLLRSPVEFSATPAKLQRRAPEVGQDTELLLLEHGFTWEEIAALKEAGAIS